ncbi:hypothetical protein [Curtobacterium herbarum]|uniref:DUF1508 domain-containing protein n=2 Tax=Curtobacterium herbarum TaxID=150122 RepID=A0ABP4K3I1_9MICO|nr:hypothetical protein [Curtobacterium herbarum]MBM7476962.1 hypothetical protein [Curtobacterium herbarum]
MDRMQAITWRNDAGGHWTARRDGVVVGTIDQGQGYELHSTDGTVRGSHNSLGNAQAQLDAWAAWGTGPQGS